MSGCRVFIGRLSPHARERDVEKFFKGYGRIREINLKNGFGFVVKAEVVDPGGPVVDDSLLASVATASPAAVAPDQCTGRGGEVHSLEGLWSGIPACCLPHVPHTLPFGSFSVADGAGVLTVGRAPPLALWWFLTCGGRIPRQGQGRFSRA
ncbi:hypothetical protein JZ751_003091 [Albula glossodonta]|uniref:RRM domain-containing protein n=1 Tax=Albula glossodonta TaxID=121402 RepID=A0A8T2N8M3_9TELE|nr:hypothetical protein JZ751_003091 [Albula glossodonta]